jgi:hypothetical protein
MDVLLMLDMKSAVKYNRLDILLDILEHRSIPPGPSLYTLVIENGDLPMLMKVHKMFGRLPNCGLTTSMYSLAARNIPMSRYLYHQGVPLPSAGDAMFANEYIGEISWEKWVEIVSMD